MHSIHTEQKDGTLIFSLGGHIDALNSSQIQERIMDEIENNCQSLIIDFSNVSYISSAGLRVLISASKAMAKESGSFFICSINQNIKKIFETVGLAEIFNIQPDVQSCFAINKKQSVS